jgi:hypothetical protein
LLAVVAVAAAAAAEHLKAGGVVLRPYEQLVADVKAKATAKARIAMDMSKVRKPVGSRCDSCSGVSVVYQWCISGVSVVYQWCSKV